MTSQHLNISAEMLEFKEAVRNSWNSYFAKYREDRSLDAFMFFSDLEISLFWAIVVNPLNLDIDPRSFRKKPFDKILLVTKDICSEFPISYGKVQDNGNVVWTLPSVIRSHKDQLFKFYDFFDWSEFGYIDYAYIRCLVENSPQDEHFTGAYGLLETRYIDFIYSD